MTIKQATLYHLPLGTAEAIRQQAAELGVPASDVVDLGLRLLLSKPAQLAQWARSRLEQQETEKRTKAELLAKEREEAAKERAAKKNAPLEAAILAALKPQDARCWAIPFQVVAMKVGELQKHVWPMLEQLEAGGKVGGMKSWQEDAWGRPRESYWWLVEAVDRSMFPGERPEELPDEGGHLLPQVWCHLGLAVETGEDLFFALEEVRRTVLEGVQASPESRFRTTRRVQAQVREMIQAALGLPDKYQKIHFTTAPDYVPEATSISG